MKNSGVDIEEEYIDNIIDNIKQKLTTDEFNFFITEMLRDTYAKDYRKKSTRIV